MVEPGIKEVLRGKFLSFYAQGDVWLNQLQRFVQQIQHEIVV